VTIGEIAFWKRARKLAEDPGRVKTGHAWILALSVAFVAAPGCAMHHLARTVGEGNGELRASAGGPFFSNLGAPVPLPNLVVAGRYGLTDGFDLDGGLSVTGLFYGTIGLQLGAVGQLVREPNGLAISLAGRGHFLIGTRGPDLRFFPELGVHLEGMPARFLVVFGGLTALAGLGAPSGKPPVFAYPYAGAEVLFGGSDEAGHPYGLAIELGWISPWQDSTSVVSWEPSGYGAIVVQLGFRARIGEGLDR
jgi:hypothetical protein